LSAGTLDLKINDADGVIKTFSLNNLKPGAWDNAGGFVLKNSGTVNGHAWLEITNINNTGANSGKLADFIKASFQENDYPAHSLRHGGASPMSTEAGTKIDLFDLNAGASMPMVLYSVWPTTYTDAQDNSVQGNGVQFDVVFHLDQIH
jgi:hypothetical protein